MKRRKGHTRLSVVCRGERKTEMQTARRDSTEKPIVAEVTLGTHSNGISPGR